MYLYTVKNIIDRSKKVFSSIAEIEKHTKLSITQIKMSITMGISIGQWEIKRESDIKTKRKTASKPRHQADDGYLAMNDKEVKYFPDKKSASKYTNVAQHVIDSCILDGGSAKGWFFDYALKREQP